MQEQQKEFKNQEELSSLVWICTSTHSATKVIIIDAIQPGNILDSFTVCNSHVLCIASVPGKRELYPSLLTSDLIWLLKVGVRVLSWSSCSSWGSSKINETND